MTLNPELRLLFVALGGALGSLSRYGVGLGLLKWAPQFSPHWGILLVNLFGSFGAGLLFPQLVTHPGGALLLLTGFFGGFTTLSTYSLDLMSLLQSSSWMRAGALLLLTSVGGPLCAWMGYTAGSLLRQSP